MFTFLKKSCTVAYLYERVGEVTIRAEKWGQELHFWPLPPSYNLNPALREGDPWKS